MERDGARFLWIKNHPGNLVALDGGNEVMSSLILIEADVIRDRLIIKDDLGHDIHVSSAAHDDPV